MPVDEFDSGVVPITDEQAKELLKFSEQFGSDLAKDIRAAYAELDQFRYLLMTLYDEMRRMKAGRFPRYLQPQLAGWT